MSSTSPLGTDDVGCVKSTSATLINFARNQRGAQAPGPRVRPVRLTLLLAVALGCASPERGALTDTAGTHKPTIVLASAAAPGASTRDATPPINQSTNQPINPVSIRAQNPDTAPHLLQSDDPLSPTNDATTADAAPQGDDEDEGDDEIQTDRPDFTESSANVPFGRLQIESGYTFSHDRETGSRSSQVPGQPTPTSHRSSAHTFPEILMRWGLSDSVELRMGWTYAVERTRLSGPGGGADTEDGATDLYLSVGFALTEQDAWFPEAKINIQGTVPTGHEEFSAEKVNAGFNLLYGWDVSDFIAMGASTGVNTVTESGDDFVRFSQSFTVGYSLTEKLGAYTEWFGLYSTDAEQNFPENYFNGGFTFKPTKDTQFDIRSGVGLNGHAGDFFTGAGYSVRF